MSRCCVSGECEPTTTKFHFTPSKWKTAWQTDMQNEKNQMKFIFTTITIWYIRYIIIRFVKWYKVIKTSFVSFEIKVSFLELFLLCLIRHARQILCRTIFRPYDVRRYHACYGLFLNYHHLKMIIFRSNACSLLIINKYEGRLQG